MTSLWDRLLGRSPRYSPDDPSPKDLVLEMRAQGRKAEAETMEIRRARAMQPLHRSGEISERYRGIQEGCE